VSVHATRWAPSSSLVRSRSSRNSVTVRPGSRATRLTIIHGMARRAIAVAAFVAFLAGCGGSGEPTTAHYLKQVAAVCDRYGRQLDQIPPPADIASPGDIVDSVGRALPILRAEARTIRALRPPHALQSELTRFFALTDRRARGGAAGGARSRLRRDRPWRDPLRPRARGGEGGRRHDWLQVLRNSTAGAADGAVLLDGACLSKSCRIDLLL